MSDFIAALGAELEAAAERLAAGSAPRRRRLALPQPSLRRAGVALAVTTTAVAAVIGIGLVGEGADETALQPPPSGPVGGASECGAAGERALRAELRILREKRRGLREEVELVAMVQARVQGQALPRGVNQAMREGGLRFAQLEHTYLVYTTDGEPRPRSGCAPRVACVAGLRGKPVKWVSACGTASALRSRGQIPAAFDGGVFGLAADGVSQITLARLLGGPVSLGVAGAGNVFEARPSGGRGRRPAVAVVPESGGARLCLRFTWPDQRALRRCDLPPTMGKPFGPVARVTTREGERLLYGVVRSDVASVDIARGRAGVATRVASGPRIFEAQQGDGVVGVTARAVDGTVLGTIGAQEPSKRRPRSSAEAQALGNPIGFAPFAE